MVISDLALGLVGLIPTAIYLGGKPMTAGSRSCDALGYVLTAVLFTQHLWTLVIAVATFALLAGILHLASFRRPGVPCVIMDLVANLWTAILSNLFLGSGRDSEDITRAREQKRAARRPSRLSKSKIAFRNMFGMKPLQAESTVEPVAEVPPWDLLQLNTAGLHLEPISSPVVLPIDEKRAALSRWPSRSASDDVSRADDMSRIDRIHTSSTLVSSTEGRNNSHDSQPKPPAPIDEKSEEFINMAVLLINDERVPSSLGNSGELPSPLQLDDQPTSAIILAPKFKSGMTVKNHSSVAFNIGGYSKEEAAGPESTEQTLRDFFEAHRATDTEVMHAHSGADIGPEESAAEYSNRQASLLMLYFPLAYLMVFSVSLVRLMHDMITTKKSSALTIISLWFVLSAGLLDALVYVRFLCTVTQTDAP
ncbi:hypothetical protein QFC21_005403 [Naganishia friedmannii]|uniref:Uncharacterized protein n=1 Tax=Naganishia friedmannii TaxID=89922 RepID=A0ACC2V9I6_9TREE|nr:hypothetical protein QFC21_005403 [Naganishia friedmannii]